MAEDKVQKKPEAASKKLRFVKEAVFNGKLVHNAGEELVVDNSTGYADRWIKRGIAIEVKSEPVAAKKDDAKGQPQAPASVANAQAPKNNGDKDL